MKRNTFRIGGKRKKKNKGRHTKSHMTKPKKNKPRKKKFGITVKRKKKPTIFISQPRNRRMNNTVRKPHFKSVSYSDSSMFSSGTNRKPIYKRRAVIDKNIDGMRKGAFMIQDNDKIKLGIYPK